MKKSAKEIREEMYEASKVLSEGQVWRHYKGGLYRIVGVATDCDTNKLCVLYNKIETADEILSNNTYNGIVFTRPFDEWFDIVDTNNTVRFERAHERSFYMTNEQERKIREQLGR